MSKLIEVLKEESRVIKGAPLSFASTVVAVGAAIVAVMLWHQREVVNAKDATIQSKDAEIAAIRESAKSKEELAGYLKERYGILPATNSFSSLRNSELRTQVNELAKQMRKLGFDYRSAMNDAYFMVATNHVDNAPFVHQRALISAAETFMTAYDSNFKMKAKFCLEELSGRLKRDPNTIGTRDRFEFPRNYQGTDAVADTLESLASLLPTSP